MAGLFFLTSLGLAVLNSKQGAAYDLMNPTAVEQETSSIPGVCSAQKAWKCTAYCAEELPVTPEVSGTGQPVRPQLTRRK